MPLHVFLLTPALATAVLHAGLSLPPEHTQVFPTNRAFAHAALSSRNAVLCTANPFSTS